MKRLILPLLALCALSGAAAAQQTVLTPDGTLYSIGTVSPDAVETFVGRPLVLRMQSEGVVTDEMIPATLDNSRNGHPAIAYDRASESIFVFWLRQLGTMSSHLMFARRNAEGVWSEPKEFGSPFVYREHLRIAVTGRVAAEDATLAPEDAVSVHLAWWEFDTHTAAESARYAMLAIEDGSIGEFQELDLSKFIQPAEAEAAAETVDTEIDLSVLRQPLLNPSPMRDSVVITFGDIETRSFHRVRLTPTKVREDVRIRIPVGRHEGKLGAPRFPVASDMRTEVVHGDSGLAIYVFAADRVDYVVYHDGSWSGPRAIALDAVTTKEVAIGAVRRLVSEQ
jgi:hypothetical protein